MLRRTLLWSVTVPVNLRYNIKTFSITTPLPTVSILVTSVCLFVCVPRYLDIVLRNVWYECARALMTHHLFNTICKYVLLSMNKTMTDDRPNRRALTTIGHAQVAFIQVFCPPTRHVHIQ